MLTPKPRSSSSLIVQSARSEAFVPDTSMLILKSSAELSDGNSDAEDRVIIVPWTRNSRQRTARRAFFRYGNCAAHSHNEGFTAGDYLELLIADFDIENSIPDSDLTESGLRGEDRRSRADENAAVELLRVNAEHTEDENCATATLSRVHCKGVWRR